MVGCSNQHTIRWQVIELHKQSGHDPFDLTGFVCVAALFADCIKLIEKQDARFSAHEIKHPS